MQIDEIKYFREEMIRICIDHTNVNAMTRRKLNRLITDLYNVNIDDTKKIRSIEAKIVETIRAKEQSSNTVSKFKKRDTIVSELSTYCKRKIGYEINEVIDGLIIDGSWGDNAIKAIRDFNNQRIAKRRKEKVAEQQTYQGRTEEHKQVKTNNGNVRTGTKETKKNDIPVKERKIPVSAIEEIISEKIMERLSGDLYQRFTLTASEKKAIRAAVGEFHDARVLDALEKGTNLLLLRRKFDNYVRAQKIPFKISYYTPSLDDVLKAASYVVDILPPELLTSDHSVQAQIASRLIANVKLDKCLENYAAIYKTYGEYFSKLPAEQQAQIKAEFEKKLANRYPNLNLGNKFQIPSPDKVTNEVNAVVSKKMIDNKNKYARERSQSTTIEILKATKYMDSDQIAAIYNQMKRDYSRDYVSYGDGYDEKRLAARSEFMENLQYNFARAIMAKEIDRKLTPEEEKQVLINICNGYFHEEATDSLTNIGHIEQRNQIMVTKINSPIGIFGIEKLRAVLGITKNVYGKYASADELGVMISERRSSTAENGKINVK